MSIHVRAMLQVVPPLSSEEPGIMKGRLSPKILGARSHINEWETCPHDEDSTKIKEPRWCRVK